MERLKLYKIALILNEMLLEGNTIPNQNYDAKKILFPMGVKYKKIH